mmetsp:Transcript_33673/g.66242  ORF Transcript_33673/g.66242 Transcript_33673/m.66242 type:complete len:101 (+) Transcript_33673:2185-2487(+)
MSMPTLFQPIRCVFNKAQVAFTSCTFLLPAHSQHHFCIVFLFTLFPCKDSFFLPHFPLFFLDLTQRRRKFGAHTPKVCFLDALLGLQVLQAQFHSSQITH